MSARSVSAAAVAAGVLFAAAAQAAVDKSLACKDSKTAKGKWNKVEMYITTFGCYPRADGTMKYDRDDNCHPACFAQVCNAKEKADVKKERRDLPTYRMQDSKGKQGPAKYYMSGDIECEKRLKYFVADNQRFGCGTKVRVTNPATGASAVAIVADHGPACWVERKAGGPILDASGMVNGCLFGKENHGASDRKVVKVEVVSASTALGCTGGRQQQAGPGKPNRQQPQQQKKPAKKAPKARQGAPSASSTN